MRLRVEALDACIAGHLLCLHCFNRLSGYPPVMPSCGVVLEPAGIYPRTTC